MARLEVTHVPAGGGVSARFWRSARVRKHSDFEKVYRGGRRIFSTHMTFFFLRRDAGPSSQQANPGPARVGFTVPRILGNAVERNRMRRRLREAVRLSLSAAGNAVDVVIHPKKSALTVEFAELREEVARGFQKIESSVVGPRPSAGGSGRVDSK